MIEYHLKIIVPLDGLFPNEDPAQDISIESFFQYIVGQPARLETVSESTTKHYIRIMQLNSLDDVKAMLIDINDSTADSVVAARNANGLQRIVKLVDADTTTTLLDWTEMPNDNGATFVDWVTANIPTA